MTHAAHLFAPALLSLLFLYGAQCNFDPSVKALPSPAPGSVAGPMVVKWDTRQRQPEQCKWQPAPADRAERLSVMGSPPLATPVLYIVTDCNVTEPTDVEPIHPQYREWLANRRYDHQSAVAPVRLWWDTHSDEDDAKHSGVVRCIRTRVTTAAQLQAVSSRITGDGRQSYRARPAVVDVVWDGLEDAVKAARVALWPPGDPLPALTPVLQAVLTYRAGDWFEAHVDRCEQNGQEGVLIVDLGLRVEDEEGDDDGINSLAEAYRPDRAELFVHHHNGTLAANWTASGPGAWIAMPMRVLHGVYVQPSRRTVAVYTLVDPTQTGQPPRRGPSSSCTVHECPPGAVCFAT